MNMRFTTHEGRVSDFQKVLKIAKRLAFDKDAKISKSELEWLCVALQSYIIDLDIAYIDILDLKGRLDTIEITTQLNSNQSIIDNKEEEN